MSLPHTDFSTRQSSATRRSISAATSGPPLSQSFTLRRRTMVTKAMAATVAAFRRLQTMAEVGLPTALATEAFAPTRQTFKRGCDSVAWPGLAPPAQKPGNADKAGDLHGTGAGAGGDGTINPWCSNLIRHGGCEKVTPGLSAMIEQTWIAETSFGFCAGKA